jgi:nicotinamidase-related amidase
MFLPDKPISTRSPALLDAERSVLLVIDLQEGFAKAISDLEVVGTRTTILVETAARLNVPILVTAQYPKALGATLESVSSALPQGTPTFEKLAFSACDVPEWATALRALAREGRDQLILCGVETHVCVMQTALDLVQNPDAVVHVAEDAVSSRKPSDKAAALRRLESHGVQIVTSEMIVFEWLRKAGTDDFKDVQRMIK